MRPRRPSALLLASTLLLAGCATTTMRSGLPPGDSPQGYEEKWHAAFLWGLVPASGPYDLDRLCPGGWSEVTVEPDTFTAVAGLITLFIYSPSRVTVVCASAGVRGDAPRAGYTLPEALRPKEARPLTGQQ